MMEHILHWVGILFGVAVIVIGTRPASPVRRKKRVWFDV